MSDDLVDRVARLFEAASGRDFDTVMRFFTRDAVWEAVSLGTSFEGAQAIRGFLEDWLGAYEEHAVDPEEILYLGSGVVFVVARLTARPAGSVGSELIRRRPLAVVWVEGLVARVTAYGDSVEDGRAAAEWLAESRA